MSTNRVQSFHNYQQCQPEVNIVRFLVNICPKNWIENIWIRRKRGRRWWWWRYCKLFLLKILVFTAWSIDNWWQADRVLISSRAPPNIWRADHTLNTLYRVVTRHCMLLWTPCTLWWVMLNSGQVRGGDIVNSSARTTIAAQIRIYTIYLCLSCAAKAARVVSCGVSCSVNF